MVGLAAGRAPQQQRDLPVGLGVLGEVIVYDQCVAALLHELLAHGATGVGGEELQRGRVRGGCRHDDGVLHRAVLFQRAHHLR